MNQQKHLDEKPGAKEGLASEAAAPLQESAFCKGLQKKYDIVRVLSLGINGTVYEAEEKATKRKVALKLITYKADSFKQSRQLLREVAIHRHLFEQQKGGPAFVPRLLDVELSEPSADSTTSEGCLVIELVPGTTLKDFLRQAQSKSILLKTEEAKALIANITKAIQFMHSAGVIHRDIKPSNLMVTPDLEVKLIDFGLARTLVYNIESQAANIPESEAQRKLIGRILDGERTTRKRCRRSLSPHVCSRPYRSPEIALTEHYSYSADIWSLGCVAAEILSSQAIYDFDETASRFLFPSLSCFTLSPGQEKVQAGKGGGHLASDDLLRAIIAFLGDLDSTDLSFITRSSKKEIIRDCFSSRGPIQFDKEFPGTAPELTTFLEGSLQFNPYFRSSASQLLSLVLASPVADLKQKSRSAEQTLEKPVAQLRLPTDWPDAYNYAEQRPTKLSAADLSIIIIEEQRKLRMNQI